MTSHKDTFVKDCLPDSHQLPEFQFEFEAIRFPKRLNCAAELLDKKITSGFADKPLYYTDQRIWTYREILETTNKIAHVLTDDLGLVTGNRVLLYGLNTPVLIACWLAIAKAGGVVVAMMPLTKANELQKIINKANISFALCDIRLREEMINTEKLSPRLKHTLFFNGTDTELEKLMNNKSGKFENVETANDDPVAIAFTSGTTGLPKGTVHYHRDIMATAICTIGPSLPVVEDDIIIGTPPLAFTMGLIIFVCFPLLVGASAVLPETSSPSLLLDAISRFDATVLITSPTTYKTMMRSYDNQDLTSLRLCIAGSEPLSRTTWDLWKENTGHSLINAIGSTELTGMFMTSALPGTPPCAIGKPLPGYSAQIMDEDMLPVVTGNSGLLAIKGPTGCRYLADDRQSDYAREGWNLTGDICHLDDNGVFWFDARADDMIISAGYNISGLEVEEALLSHTAVADCAVVASPDIDRGNIVKGYIVLNDNYEGTPELTLELQEYVKQIIAPYKYPRAIEFISQLPKTQSGKIQRHKLRKKELSDQ